MTDKNTLLFYVTDPIASAAFYTTLLQQPPAETSPGFALFVLPSGLPLGLWRADTVLPAPAVAGGGNELGFAVASPADVDACHTAWSARGIPILLPPTDMDFGRSFVATDPDGHRLRVYAMFEGM